MYRLTIVAGPHTGDSFEIQEGVNAIGRQAGNEVTLRSPQVSKRHCVLVASNGEFVVHDQGSANGTFVNGVLTKEKRLSPGDRLGVGDYVLELSALTARGLPSSGGRGQPSGQPSSQPPGLRVIPGGAGGAIDLVGPGDQALVISDGESGLSTGPNVGDIGAGGSGLGPLDGATPAKLPPKDLKSKIVDAFENKLMPVFYELNEKYEWKTLATSIIGVFLLIVIVLTIFPLVESSRSTLIREAGRRASFMAKQIAERNSGALAAQQETKTDVGSIERAQGVRLAVLVDLDSRVISPAEKLNSYLVSGPEAVFAVKAREQFRTGRETGLISVLDAGTICAIEPVKILNAALGRNVVIAMAIVSIDTSIAVADFGEIGIVYGQAIIIAALIAAFVFLVLYKLTLKPYAALEDEMNQVLRGDKDEISIPYKVEEANGLWDLVKSALQRIPKDSAGSSTAEFNLDDAIAPIRALSEAAPTPMLICGPDRKIIGMNAAFEEVSGIRIDSALGQDFAGIARDQGMPQFFNDLFDRAMPASGSVSESYEFSGVPYQVHVSAGGSSGGIAQYYVIIAVKSGAE